MADEFATTYTQGTGSGTTNVAANAQSIDVYGITLSNTANNIATITFNTTESSVSPILIIFVSARATMTFDTPFKADKGLQWVGSGNDPGSVEITVFHSNVGA